MTSAAIDDPLTPRETQVPCHVAYELSNHEIAESPKSALDGQRTRPEPASETRWRRPNAGSRVGGAVWNGVGLADYAALPPLKGASSWRQSGLPARKRGKATACWEPRHANRRCICAGCGFFRRHDVIEAHLRRA